MKKQSLVKGTIILGAAGIVARFLGIFFRIPLQNLIGDEGIGYYQMTYPLYMFFIAACSGIPVAISKMVSERNAVGDRRGIMEVFKASITFMLIMGAGVSSLLLIFSNQIINLFKWSSKSYYSIIGIGLAPLFICIMSTFRGFFQGMQNMNFTAVSQIIEQIGRVIIGVTLAYILLPKGIEYSAGGAAFGAAAGGILGGIYLFIRYKKVRKEFMVGTIKSSERVMGELLKIAIPISIGAAVGTIMNVIDSALVPQKLLEAGYTYKEASILYGQLTGKAFVLINVPLTLSSALCASLVPIIAEANKIGNKMEVKEKVQKALKVSCIIAIPSMFGLYFMARPVLKLVFLGQDGGYNILKYSSVCLFFIIIAQTTTAILQGTGRVKRPVLNLLIGCIVKIIFTLMLVPIPRINIYGAVIGTLLGYVVSSLLNLRFLSKEFKISINYYEIIIKPTFASVIMIIIVVFTYLKVYNYTVSNGISCIISILVGIIVYGIFMIITGIFDYNKLKNRIIKKQKERSL